MGVRKKSALIKILLFFGEMSVMTIEELNELSISYGLELKIQDTSYYGFFGM